MPASQLKQLKASLRDQGVLGPQKSKKQKKQASKADATRERRIARNEALENIRDKFNPFEAKAPTKRTKFQFANAQNNSAPIQRPGVTKGLGEEVRRRTLLTEIQRRHKVGGINDRRFGETDPTLTPEERALERAQKQRRGKKSALFDLEDDYGDDGEAELTHLGQLLSVSNGDAKDDFQESLSETDTEGAERGKKRRRLSNEENWLAEEKSAHDAEPDRPKTKQDIMQEVIAKSKAHRYERQKAKEDDDDLREELDQGLGDLYSLLKGQKVPPKPESHAESRTEPTMNPDRQALLNGQDREAADREYDRRLREMTLDQRAKPSHRQKTEEEKAEEEATKLKELENQRLRRMRSEDSSNDEENPGADGDDDFIDDEAEAKKAVVESEPVRRELDVEDEDEFVLDSGLIASGSELELSEADDGSFEDFEEEANDEEGESVEDLGETFGESGSSLPNGDTPHESINGTGLAFTFPCPQSMEEFLMLTKDKSADDLHTIIQRIRTLYNPKLNSGNRELLENFSAILVQYIPYLVSLETRPSFAVVEKLIRHVHSLAKGFPTTVAKAFRDQLKLIKNERPTALDAGDLVTMVAIGTIFSTSDHWHQVCNAAILTMARYLGQKIPKTVADLAKKSYIATLCLEWQQLSKRYVPEVVNHVLNAIYMLSPSLSDKAFGLHPDHGSLEALRIGSSGEISVLERIPNFWDIEVDQGSAHIEDVKLSLLRINLSLIEVMASLWSGKSALPEILKPFLVALKHLDSKVCGTKLPASIQETTKTLRVDIDSKLEQALHNRLPLALHNHRPLPIKFALPKFEESYHPDKHYDPQRERSELSKLKAEHKRERKGALRELRKDANFIAREKLREKKEKDEAYEKKYRRLVAEIQGEEGREAKAYEREKRARKRKR